MATLFVCAAYDSKAESFSNPFYVPALGVATRDFTDAFTAPDSKMGKHKDDFMLYHVATFDTSTGSFESVIPPRLILKGADILSE